MDNTAEFRVQPHQVGGIQETFKDGILQMISVRPHSQENFPEPLIVRDVVTDQVGFAHLGLNLRLERGRLKVGMEPRRKAPRNFRESNVCSLDLNVLQLGPTGVFWHFPQHSRLAPKEEGDYGSSYGLLVV